MKNPANGSIIPGMRYHDAPKAIDWLCNAFGFSRHLVVPDDSGGIAHAQLTLGNGMIMLGMTISSPRLGRREPRPRPPISSSKKSTSITGGPSRPGPKSPMRLPTRNTVAACILPATLKGTSGTLALTILGRTTPDISSEDI